MSFWFDYENLEPKRAFTFILSIGGEPSGDDVPNESLKIDEYLIKKVTKPGFETSMTEHKFLNHSFKYPGRVTWKEVSFTVVDAVTPNTAHRFLKILQESGYRTPKGAIDAGDGSAKTISKKNSVRALGTPRIHQIDHDGAIVDTWKLYGAWVKKVEQTELSYDSDDIIDITVSLEYDFAECVFKQGADASGQTLPGSNR